MSVMQTQIKIDNDVAMPVTELFEELGMDLTGAVNIFLRQCLLRGGLPFSVEVPNYRKETLAAMQEAIRIADDDNVPSYDNMEDFKKAFNLIKISDYILRNSFKK